MTIDDIKADVKMEMTELLLRAFQAAGCEPSCHCCYSEIKVGDEFKLAIVVSTKVGHQEETLDEMLCNKCTPAKLIKRRKMNIKNNDAIRARKIARGESGFSRIHKGPSYHLHQHMGFSRVNKDVDNN